MTDCFKSGFLGTFGAGGLLLWNASAFVEREQKCLEQRHQQDIKIIEERHKKDFEELKKEVEELNQKAVKELTRKKKYDCDDYNHNDKMFK